MECCPVSIGRGVLTYLAFSVRDRRGGTPWLPCKSGPSRRRRLFPAAARRHSCAGTSRSRRSRTGRVAGPAPAAGAGPEGQLTWGVHISLAPTWFDPAETPGIITPFMVMYALHDAMVKPMPGKPLAPSLAKSWTVSAGRPHLRVRAAQGREVPQRRAGHGRGREVLLRALSRRLATRRSRTGWPRSRRPIPSSVRFKLKAAVARLPHLLRERHRRRLDRAQEVRGEGRRRGLQEGADRRRPLQVRLVHAGRGADARGLRPVLAQDAQRQAPGVQGRSPTSRRGWPRSSAARSTSSTRSAASSPRSCSAPRGSPSSRPSSRRRSGSTSPTSGTRSRHGTTSACGWRPAWPSTARPSTRR